MQGDFSNQSHPEGMSPGEIGGQEMIIKASTPGFWRFYDEVKGRFVQLSSQIEKCQHNNKKAYRLTYFDRRGTRVEYFDNLPEAKAKMQEVGL